jgi:hypothetical protein
MGISGVKMGSWVGVGLDTWHAVDLCRLLSVGSVGRLNAPTDPPAFVKAHRISCL